MDRREMMGECVQSLARALPLILPSGLFAGMLKLAAPDAGDTEKPAGGDAFPTGPQPAKAEPEEEQTNTER